ncbi:MAG TPA: NAD(P)/FAD-dependent oxidoreductase [Gaiellaceae bacterium]|nr:NAD(P)/FAD-dependent oxidoreductase [Gaiellaceae bacterium]
MPNPDAVVVGSGPNGLAAAVTLARAGRSVLVVERAESVGGGLRSAELTEPGFVHDVCSAIHPLAAASPCFSELPLSEHGLELVHPDAPLAHPLDDGTAVMLERSVDATAAGLGADGERYRKLFGPLVRNERRLLPFLLGPRPLPRHPFAAARFGLLALRSAAGLAKRFEGERARALFAGLAAHSIQSLRRSPTASFGLVLGMLGHAYGWPAARGGSQAIADALVSYLRSLGGVVETGRAVESVDELPRTAILLDLTPRGVIGVAGHRLPSRYLRALRRYRYGPGVFKLDWALDGPVPWAAEDCGRAGTVHVGGTAAEIVESEDAVWRGEASERPYVLVAQQSLFDDTRAPADGHTLWAYCHVPNGSTVDMTERIEAQIERFAPGFRERILARHAMGPADVEARNPNYVGGDINGGVQDLRQLYTRPAVRLDPYSTPVDGLYVCSSSTPPGGGVHGMCGYHAARSTLRWMR